MGTWVVLAVWAAEVAWVGRLADNRGRSILVWGLLGAAGGFAGFWTGVLFVGWLWAHDSENVFVLASLLIPPALGYLATFGVGMFLASRSVWVRERKHWQVQATRGGGAQLSIAEDRLELNWEGRMETVTAEQLRGVEVDGECVRVSWTVADPMHATDVEHLLLPMGRPQTREGRQQQSRVLARLILDTKSRASARDAPA